MLASSTFLAVAGLTPVAQAQEGSDEPIEEIITTGTRRAERSASDSSVPIDVVGGEELVNIGTHDLDDMLRTTVPSYNIQSHSIDDAATLVRPATMRGLPPDNVLIMVNGKRRHRSGVIAELGSSLNEGSQGPDISAIPALAIKQVEVLRDGAAAQYGSDAIAGVMNFVLRDDADGVTLEARTGEYMEGDGTLVQLMGNAGFPLGDDGFFNVTGVWSEADPTSRSIQRTDAATLLSSGAPDQQASVREPYAQIWGRPEYRDNWNIFANSGIQLNESQEVYLFGNYGKRETEGGFYYRNPNSRSAVYTHDQSVTTDAINDTTFDVSYRAVVDTNINRGDTNVVSNCPALVSPGSGGDGVPLDATTVSADWDARQNLPANCWVMNQAVPGGYTPQFGGNLTDASIVGGIRGEMNNGLLYDFSGGYGRNKVEFFLNNTWNPARGPDGVDANGNLQRDFDVGSYVQSEVNLNADFVLPIAVDAFASDLNFAFGAEWRDEIFETIIGEVNSWEAGRFAFQSGNGSNCYGDPNNPGTCDVIRDANGAPVLADTDGDGVGDATQIARLPDLSIGSHGFAGFNPPQAGQWGRSNWAVYVEAEADVTDNFTAAVAVRYEDFATFGDTTNGKIALRWGITDTFAVRGSFSTGFRAPTPGQENVTKVSTILINDELSQSGQIPPTNPIAQFLGGKQLEPEEADNFSVGVVWDVTDNFSITADYFNINVSDRIAFTGTIDITEEGVPDAGDIPGGRDCPNARANPIGNLALCLQELGVPGAADLSSVSFYTNDFETTTQGIDLVATLDLDWGNAGSGSLTFLWNWTETEVDSAGSEVDRNKVVDLENMNPENRGVLTYNHFVGDWRFLARASYYDDWVNSQWGGDDPTDRGADGAGYTLSCAGPAFNDHCYSGETIVDLEAAYTFADQYTVAVGANNVFDEFGADDLANADGTIGAGNLYTDTTPWGIEGGFWYLRFRAEFE
jgi:iron complex outermembrane receptor protein